MSLKGAMGTLLAGIALMPAVAGCQSTAEAASPPRLSPKGLVLTRQAPAVLPATELASFAAGCFWGVEQEFRKEPGVMATAVGYSGGHTVAPSYEEVCTGTTGHAETVRVEFDPTVTSYDHLLDVFWNLHDPTTRNRQGPDVGEQYRSIIFTFSPEQRAKAIASRDKLQRSGELRAPIVTEILAAAPFTMAEAYHQQYVEKGGRAACHLRRPRGTSL